jgi:ribulose-phosphate 3-epimerase|uniref:Ribulose-phosphate 3-epimerase n=1 Tax=candidate division WOR-3 bacterium TaxID=2052148 RepID=A0A7C3UNG7_UNCW3
MKISASILNCNFLQLGNEIKKAEEAGIDSFHLDVMDGHFVPNLSFGTPILKVVRQVTQKPIFSHLMVWEPEKMIERFLPDSDGVIFHIEATKKVKECITLIHQANRLCGIACNPETPYSHLLPHLEEVEDILVMSVHPGFGGQRFIPDVLDKIKRLKEIGKEKRLSFIVSVDGGVNKDNVSLLKEAGVDMIIVGTYLFHSSDYKKALAELRCST